MGSLLGIAQTKAAIYRALPADGVAVINADDAFCQYFFDIAKPRHCLFFGIEPSADIRAAALALDADGTRFTLCLPGSRLPIRLCLPGCHNVMNALAARSAEHTPELQSTMRT